MTTVITPVRKTIEVGCAPERAFEVFTAEIGTWWPLGEKSMLDGRATNCTFGTAVGEEIYETAPDGSRGVWGRVLVWDPPRRVSFSWKPNTNDLPPTEVDVTFEASDGGTTVTLVHSGWERLGEVAEQTRAGYDTGWVSVLDRFVAAAGARESA